MYLSVIVPAYNEERRLPKTLFEIDKYLRTRDYDYEIIVVSDGSKDRTAEVVRDLKLSRQAGSRKAGKIANLRLIDNKENHGKGFVVRQGLSEARGRYRLFTDADNSTSIDQVEKLFPCFKEGYDIVIGSRDVKGAVIANPQARYRILLGNIFNLMVQALTGLWGIWDTQCGFKALTAEAVNGILPKCRIDRWAFDPEILKVGRKLGYRTKEVPIVWVNDPESKVKFRGMVRMGFDLLKIRWNLITGKYR